MGRGSYGSSKIGKLCILGLSQITKAARILIDRSGSALPVRRGSSTAADPVVRSLAPDFMSTPGIQRVLEGFHDVPGVRLKPPPTQSQEFCGTERLNHIV